MLSHAFINSNNMLSHAFMDRMPSGLLRQPFIWKRSTRRNRLQSKLNRFKPYLTGSNGFPSMRRKEPRCHAAHVSSSWRCHWLSLIHATLGFVYKPSRRSTSWQLLGAKTAGSCGCSSERAEFYFDFQLEPAYHSRPC